MARAYRVVLVCLVGIICSAAQAISHSRELEKLVTDDPLYVASNDDLDRIWKTEEFESLRKKIPDLYSQSYEVAKSNPKAAIAWVLYLNCSAQGNNDNCRSRTGYHKDRFLLTTPEVAASDYYRTEVLNQTWLKKLGRDGENKLIFASESFWAVKYLEKDDPVLHSGMNVLSEVEIRHVISDGVEEYLSRSHRSGALGKFLSMHLDSNEEQLFFAVNKIFSSLTPVDLRHFREVLNHLLTYEARPENLSDQIYVLMLIANDDHINGWPSDLSRREFISTASRMSKSCSTDRCAIPLLVIAHHELNERVRWSDFDRGRQIMLDIASRLSANKSEDIRAYAKILPEIFNLREAYKKSDLPKIEKLSLFIYEFVINLDFHSNRDNLIDFYSFATEAIAQGMSYGVIQNPVAKLERLQSKVSHFQFSKNSSPLDGRLQSLREALIYGIDGLIKRHLNSVATGSLDTFRVDGEGISNDVFDHPFEILKSIASDVEAGDQKKVLENLTRLKTSLEKRYYAGELLPIPVLFEFIDKNIEALEILARDEVRKKNALRLIDPESLVAGSIGLALSYQDGLQVDDEWGLSRVMQLQNSLVSRYFTKRYINRTYDHYERLSGSRLSSEDFLSSRAETIRHVVNTLLIEGNTEEALEGLSVLKELERIHFIGTLRNMDTRFLPRFTYNNAEKRVLNEQNSYQREVLLLKPKFAFPENGSQKRLVEERLKKLQTNFRDRLRDLGSAKPAKKRAQSADMANFFRADGNVLLFSTRKKGIDLLLRSPSQTFTSSIPIDLKSLRKAATEDYAFLSNPENIQQVFNSKLRKLLEPHLKTFFASVTFDSSLPLYLVPDDVLSIIPPILLLPEQADLSMPISLFVTGNKRLSHGENLSTSFFGITKELSGYSPLKSVLDESFFFRSSKVPFPGKSVHVLVDEHYTKTNLIEAFNLNPALIHISSHFKASGKGGGGDHLLLGDGNLLTANDLLSSIHGKGGPKLLVLAACETAAPKGTYFSSADGFKGLAGEVVRYGSGSVIGSLWKIEDSSAAAFFKLFYFFRYEQRQAANLALQSAQQVFKSSGSGINKKQKERIEEVLGANFFNKIKGLSHPFFWSGYVILEG